MATPTLTQAIAAIKSGRRTEGRTMLEQILASDSRNITALLWMTEVADSADERRKYLGRVLSIDPNNTHARKGLESLEAVNSQPTQVAPAKPTTAQSSDFKTASTTDSTKAGWTKSQKVLAAAAGILVLLVVVLQLSSQPRYVPTVPTSIFVNPRPTEPVIYAVDYVRINDDLDCRPDFYYRSVRYKYVQISGTVTNIGRYTLVFVQLRATIYDGQGKQVSSNSFYISSDKLPSGSISSYEYYMDDSNQVYWNDTSARCVVTVEDARFEQ